MMLMVVMAADDGDDGDDDVTDDDEDDDEDEVEDDDVVDNVGLGDRPATSSSDTLSAVQIENYGRVWSKSIPLATSESIDYD